MICIKVFSLENNEGQRGSWKKRGNCVHQCLVEDLDLPVIETSNYGVIVGNGKVFRVKVFVRL